MQIPKSAFHRGMLGTIKQEEEIPYQNIINLLGSTNAISNIKKNSNHNIESTILQEIESFHKFYNQRYQQSKQNYEKLNKLNWQYAQKIIKYEQALQNYQIMHFQSKQNIAFLEKQIKQVQVLSQKKISQVLSILRLKENQIQQLRFLQSNNPKHQIPKRKIVKLRDKSKIEYQQNLNLDTARSQRQMNNLREQIQYYQKQIQELTKENQTLKRKVKHLQTDRKYQNQRLKNATLSLQLDLKLKNQQIQRQVNQLKIYQKKFEQLIQKFQICSKTNASQKVLQNFNFIEQSKGQTFDSGAQYSYQNIQSQFMTSGDERQVRNPDIQATQKKAKKSHKRYGSSNLQCEKMKQNKNQNLNMKIKIYKYNKKYV